MKYVELLNGQRAKVDDEDYDWLVEWNWRKNPQGYASSTQELEGRVQLMHRLILKTPKGKFTDHINGDKLDNRRSNLRVCTPGQNCANSATPKTNTSGYRGVYYHKGGRKWMAYITASGRRYHLGLYSDIHEAARAYNRKALEMWGEFARLNQL